MPFIPFIPFTNLNHPKHFCSNSVNKIIPVPSLKFNFNSVLSCFYLSTSQKLHIKFLHLSETQGCGMPFK